MFEYSKTAKFGIKFDLKKFYHEIDIAEDHQKYFCFMYQMDDNQNHTYFVWTTLPYGYTRAPFIARQIMKPLIASVADPYILYTDPDPAFLQYTDPDPEESIIYRSDWIRIRIRPQVFTRHKENLDDFFEIFLCFFDKFPLFR